METTPARQQLGDDLLTADQIQTTVEEVLATTQFIDIHTHLFAPEFGGLGLWGIDELLTYHYLEAELFPLVEYFSRALLGNAEARAGRCHLAGAVR